MNEDEARQLLQSAERIVDAATIARSLHRLAAEIEAALFDRMPLLLVVMRGAVVFAGQLLPLLRFPLELDYVHATRYGDTTRGGTLEWEARPRSDVQGRTVLLLDDILDQGLTLASLREALLAEGASTVRVAVLADKAIARPKPVHADFVGLTVPDRYVFGFGMDVRGAWRNLPEIYALPAEDRGTAPR